MNEMETFFQILMFGNGIYLYLMIFVGLSFLFASRIRFLSIPSMVCCLFQAYLYIQQENNQNYMFPIVVLMVALVFHGIYFYTGYKGKS